MRKVAVHDVITVGRLAVSAGLLAVQVVKVWLHRAGRLGERLRQLAFERGAQEAQSPSGVGQKERARIAEPLLAHADRQLLLGRMEVVQEGQGGERCQWSMVAWVRKWPD